jgi:Fe-S cluster assembly protein SufD
MSSSQPFIDATRARARQLDRRLPGIERSGSVAELVRSGVPSGKLETWKYTPIRAFFESPFADADAPTATPGRSEGRFLTFAGAAQITFRGAIPDVSAVEPAQGLRITSIRKTDARLNQSIDFERYPLAHVNTALLEDALVIDVDPGVDAGTLDLRFGSGADTANVSRVLIRLGAGSALKFVEQRSEDLPTNSVLEMHVGDQARLEHVRVLPAGAAACWHLVCASVGANGTYDLTGHAMGSTTRRSDIHVRLVGDHAATNLDLACATTGREKLDHQVVVEHVGRDTVSRQIVHGIAAGSSELTFNGRIHIHPGAQRSDARLTNKNLLLDRKARVNTKPELEIYANDVKCSHGATVGQIDPVQLFYLRTRGLDEVTARAMLTRAFLASRLTPWLHDAGVLGLYTELFSQ